MNPESAKLATEPYDVARHLRTYEEARLFLDACLEDGNGDFTLTVKALDAAARAFALQWLNTSAAPFPSR